MIDKKIEYQIVMRVSHLQILRKMAIELDCIYKKSNQGSVPELIAKIATKEIIPLVKGKPNKSIIKEKAKRYNLRAIPSHLQQFKIIAKECGYIYTRKGIVEGSVANFLKAIANNEIILVKKNGG